MQLYIDDRLLAADADEAALERALARFLALGHKRLELRREPKRQLTLSRWESEVFIEVETPGRVDGALAAGWEVAAQAARDYLAGKAAKAPWPKLVAGLVDIMIGEPDDDCPLCRQMKERRA